MTGRPAVLQAVFPNNVALGPLPSGTLYRSPGGHRRHRRRGGGRDDRPVDGKTSGWRRAPSRHAVWWRTTSRAARR